MANSSVSVPCQGTHIALGPRMTGWSGKALSDPREKLNARDDKLPFKESEPDQL